MALVWQSMNGMADNSSVNKLIFDNRITHSALSILSKCNPYKRVLDYRYYRYKR